MYAMFYNISEGYKSVKQEHTVHQIISSKSERFGLIAGEIFAICWVILSKIKIYKWLSNIHLSL